MYDAFMSLPVPDKISRSRRKTLSLIIRPNGEFEVKAPRTASGHMITDFIQRKQVWIRTRIAAARQNQVHRQQYSDQDIQRFRSTARLKLVPHVEYWSMIMKAEYGTIRIKNTTSRWGSCSNLNNLNFHWKLAFFPEEVMTYVIIHELAHVFEKNHSAAFWAIVQRYCPDWKVQRKWLRTEAATFWIEG